MIDVPIPLKEYRTIVENDYTESGYFLENVVIVKVNGNKTWRFFSGNQPYRLETFNRAGRKELVLQPETLHDRLAEVFQIPGDKIAAGLAYVQSTAVELVNRSIALPMVVEGSVT